MTHKETVDALIDPPIGKEGCVRYLTIEDTEAIKAMREENEQLRVDCLYMLEQMEDMLEVGYRTIYQDRPKFIKRMEAINPKEEK